MFFIATRNCCVNPEFCEALHVGEKLEKLFLNICGPVDTLLKPRSWSYSAAVGSINVKRGKSFISIRKKGIAGGALTNDP